MRMGHELWAIDSERIIIKQLIRSRLFMRLGVLHAVPWYRNRAIKLGSPRIDFVSDHSIICLFSFFFYFLFCLFLWFVIFWWKSDCRCFSFGFSFIRCVHIVGSCIDLPNPGYVKANSATQTRLNLVTLLGYYKIFFNLTELSHSMIYIKPSTVCCLFARSACSLTQKTKFVEIIYE